MKLMKLFASRRKKKNVNVNLKKRKNFYNKKTLVNAKNVKMHLLKPKKLKKKRMHANFSKQNYCKRIKRNCEQRRKKKSVNDSKTSGMSAIGKRTRRSWRSSLSMIRMSRRLKKRKRLGVRMKRRGKKLSVLPVKLKKLRKKQRLN